MWQNDFFTQEFWTDDYWPTGQFVAYPAVGSQPAGRKKRNRILEHMYAEAERKLKQRAINEKIRREVLMHTRNQHEDAKAIMQRRAAMAMILAEA